MGKRKTASEEWNSNILICIITCCPYFTCKIPCFNYNLYYMSNNLQQKGSVSTQYSTLVYTCKKEAMLLYCRDVGDELSLVCSVLYKERGAMCCVYAVGPGTLYPECIIVYTTDTLEWFAYPQIRTLHTSRECVWSKAQHHVATEHQFQEMR